MNESITIALITGAVTLTGNLLANWSARKRDAVDNAVRDQKIEDSIKELSKRVDAHNGMSDRIANIEKAIVRIDTKIEESHSKK